LLNSSPLICLLGYCSQEEDCHQEVGRQEARGQEKDRRQEEDCHQEKDHHQEEAVNHISISIFQVVAPRMMCPSLVLVY